MARFTVLALRLIRKSFENFRKFLEIFEKYSEILLQNQREIFDNFENI